MKKAVLFGMAALLLASSLALVSCGGDGGGGSNKFTGTWVTSSLTIMSTPLSVPATLKFGASDWTFTVPSSGISEKGNYSLTPNANSVFLFQNGSNVGQATILNSTMSVTLTIPGSLYGSNGKFTKQ